MPHLVFSSPMPAPADALFAWHERPGAFERLAPPWLDVRLVYSEGIQDGDRALIRLAPGVRWRARHEDYERGRQFADTQERGPFAAWHHVHQMQPEGAGASRLTDRITYRLPLGALGNRVAGRFVQHQLQAQFAYRHRTTADDLRAHGRYSSRPMRIAITGASGLIGTALTHFLTTGGHTVVPISRQRGKDDADTVLWNPRTGEIEADKLEGLDAVVHLAGENVFALRWTDDKKERILASRTRGTELLARTLARLERKPRVLASASGTGIYGDRGEGVVTEATPPSESGFLSLVCRQWEAATAPAEDAGIRVAHLRTAPVLTPRGGPLELMLPVFKMGLGGGVGSGEQWFPWIALDDALGGYLHTLVTESISGPVNLAAPQPVTMATFVDTLGEVLRRPTFFSVPASLLQLVAGEAADEIILQSTRAVPTVLEKTGYQFRFPELGGALRHLLGKETLPPAP